MEVSGEVADLLVKEGLQVAEAAAKLAGKGAVNAAALLVALLKGNYKTVGKVGVERLNKENAEAVIVPIRAEDLSRFEKLAKQYGALYAAVQSKDGHSDVVHIISITPHILTPFYRLWAMRHRRGGTRTNQKKHKPLHARNPIKSAGVA